MLNWFLRRDSICLSAVFFYLLPLLFVEGYGLFDQWIAFSLRLLSLSFGTLMLCLLMHTWETNLKLPSTEEPTAEPEPIIQPEERDTTAEELETLKAAHAHFCTESEKTIEALSKENQLLLDQVAHKEHLLEMGEQTHNDLRATQERKQQRITQLETKVRDLSYEIKTLLQLAEIPEMTAPEKTGYILNDSTQPFRLDPKRPQEKLVQSYEEASQQLKRCIDMAQKMTGASHYSSSNSRFRGIPVDNFALDLRCLFDSLRSETSCTILFYSPKENKLLFANDHASKLVGWSPDKFTQNFDSLIQEGHEEWTNSIKLLAAQNECKLRLVLKSRSGEDILVHGLMGMIPTGIFRHHIIAILYTADHRQAASNAI